MNQDPKQNLLETLQKFDAVMLTTRRLDGKLHARPMVMAEISESGELWFVASRKSSAATEAIADPYAVITGQHGDTYVCVNGVLDVVDDPALLRVYWREAWMAWFPKGKTDPDLVLLCMRPVSGEYWSAGGQPLRHFFQEVEALVSGGAPPPNNNEVERHAHVRL